MKTLLVILGLLSSFALFSQTSGKRAVLDEKSKTELLTIFKMNEKLHDAFFKSDFVAAEKHALELKKSIDNLKNSEIKKALTFSASKLADIKASNSRSVNNKNYHLFSSALIYQLNKYDIGNEYDAFYCPMEKKKWIQNAKKHAGVMNPYATEMPTCGNQETHYIHSGHGSM